MKLNVSILIEQLLDYMICSKQDSVSDELNLNRPEHYIEQHILLKNHLYIACAESLPDTLEVESDACLICIGKPSEIFFEQDLDIICVSNKLSIPLLFNLVQSVFDHYDSWDYNLQQCLNSNAELQDMIDYSDAIFHNPIYFSDADYRILAESHNNPLNIKYNYIPEKCLNELKYSENYEQMWHSGKPTISYHDYRHLSIVVRSQGQFIAFISIMEAQTPFQNSTSALLKHMATYVLIHFEQNQIRDKNQYPSLNAMFKQLLNKQQIAEPIFEKALLSLGWKADHTYCVYFIELAEMNIRYNMIKSESAQIERILESAVMVFEYQNNICAVVNLSLLPNSEKRESELQSHLHSSNLKAGRSKHFNRVIHIRNYYLQAFSALDIGKSTDSSRYHYNFEDYCLEYILKSPCQDLTPESLCPEGLLQMRAYDKRHGTQYILTLKTYFNEKFNATHAARCLYIHRTTLLERLNKISNFLNMDLENPRTCLYLMIALELIDC